MLERFTCPEKRYIEPERTATNNELSSNLQGVDRLKYVGAGLIVLGFGVGQVTTQILPSSGEGPHITNILLSSIPNIGISILGGYEISSALRKSKRTVLETYRRGLRIRKGKLTRKVEDDILNADFRVIDDSSNKLLK